MALVVGGVAVDLTANAAQIIGEMNRAASAVQKASGQMQNSLGGWQRGFANAERGINQSLSRVGAGLRSLQGIAAGLGVALGVREIIRYADSWKQVDAQLTLVTKNADLAAETHAVLFGMAQDLGVSLDALSTIYLRTARNADSLGINEQEVLDVTESLAAAIKLTGGSTESASAALFQLSQSFSSGVLRGEELNSISEQLPIVLDAIAEATGKTRSEIISYAKENGIAADLVIDSLLRQRDAWIEQADTVGGTVEQAMLRVRQAVERLAGTGGQGGAFQPLIDGLEAVATYLESDRITQQIYIMGQGIQEFATTSRNEFLRLGAVISAVMEGRFADAMDIATGKVRELEESYTTLTRAQAQALGVPFLSEEPFGPPLPPPPPPPPLELRGGPAGTASSTTTSRTATSPRGEVFGPPKPPKIPINIVKQGEQPMVAGLGFVASPEQFKAAQAGLEETSSAIDDFANHAIQAATAAGSLAAAISASGEANPMATAGAILTSLAGITTAAISAAAAFAALKTAQGDFTAVARVVAAGFAVAGALLSVVGSAGARAAGGPVHRDRPYMVGERGPELFVPSRAGNIVPNSALSGNGGGGQTVLNIDARGATPGVEARIMNLIYAHAPSAVQNATSRGRVRGRPSI